jgi:N-acetylmuramoyl-L-alanine amidase
MIKIILIIIICLNSFNLKAIDRVIENIRISDSKENKASRIVFDLSKKMPYSVFVLNNTPRLVVDIEAEKYKNYLFKESRLIENIRIRRTEKGVIRVVFDLKNSAYIDKNFYLNKTSNKFFRLVIDIKETKSVFGNKKNKKIKKRKFIITLDAGHGGIDPGASNLGKKEKDITLKAAKELKEILKNKNYKVYLTRSTDQFISLSKRRKIAKKNKSDLFISLHVDSLKKKSTRGTSVYTLSDKASDRITARLAERENKVDMIAGVNLEDVDNEVASILLDLTRRDTKNSSSFFAEAYIKRVRENGHRLLRRPHRHAGFAVLKSPDIPAVLIELGFLSNTKDVRLLSNKKSRKRLLTSLAEAIDAYVKLKTKNLVF